MQLKGKPHQELEIAALKKKKKKRLLKKKKGKKKEYLSCLEMEKRDSSGKPDQEDTLLEN